MNTRRAPASPASSGIPPSSHGRRRPTAGGRIPAPARGAGALIMVMMMVLATSMAMLYANRSLVFEQRTAANQLQSLMAQEVAEAGIEWAVGMLNSPYDIGSNCAALASSVRSFRLRYVLTRAEDATNPTIDVAPATTVYPGCKLTAAGLACDCPTPNGTTTLAANLGTTVAPSFTVAFDPVSGDTEAVRVTAYGCNARAASCAPSNFASAEGNARITAILKLRPMLRAMPASPLTCGTSCTLSGSYNIHNTDVATNGILINAGTTISTSNGTTSTTLPGLPAANAMVGADASLSALSSVDPTCSNSRMFNAYFGATLEQFRDAPTTTRLSCSSASDCNTKLNDAYDAGARSFYFDTDLHLSGNRVYGSVAKPITIVTPNAIDINGNNEFYGLIFSNSAVWNDLGTGSAIIHGAQLSCAAYKNNGNGTLTYDPDVLRGVRAQTGLMVRVPGSWRDFKVEADTRP